MTSITPNINFLQSDSVKWTPTDWIITTSTSRESLKITIPPTLPEFTAFPKMGRLSREMIISEKIDGTNAQVFITEQGELFAGSRTRWITTTDDNHGFARWVEGNKAELLKLGPGRHFGEWWGSGIQRGYGLPKGEKRFSMFNTIRWVEYGNEAKQIVTQDPTIEKYQVVLPECCRLVPLLYKGLFDTVVIDRMLGHLKIFGSVASPGFMNPEGVIAFHTAANVGFKKTLDKDEVPKSKIK